MQTIVATITIEDRGLFLHRAIYRRHRTHPRCLHSADQRQFKRKGNRNAERTVYAHYSDS